MFNISKLVNRITDRGQGNGREDTGEGSSFMESADQHSAEGFLCPPCMRAFPSAEELEEHYNATHLNNEGNPPPSDSQSSKNGDVEVLRQEIEILHSCLNDEKTISAELRNEVLKMQTGLLKDNVSIGSREEELEHAYNFIKDKKIEDLETEVKRLSNDAIQLRSNQQELQNSNEKLLIEIERKTVELDNVSHLLEEMKETKQNLEEKLSTSEKEKAEIQETSSVHVTAVDDDEFKDDTVTNAMQIKSLETEVKRLSNDAIQLKSNQQELQSSNKKLLIEIEGKTVELAKISKLLHELQEIKTKLEEKLSTSEKEKAEIQETSSVYVKTLEDELKGDILAKCMQIKSLETEVKRLSNDAIQLRSNQQELQSSNEKLLIEIEVKTVELAKITQALKEMQETKKQLEEKLLTSEKEKVKIQETSSAHVKTLNDELKGKSEVLKKITSELEQTKKSSQDAIIKLKGELEQSKEDGREKEQQLDGLRETIQDVRSRYEEKDGKMQVLQVQTDELLAEKIDLEKRVKSSEEEKSLLLDRCLTGENEVEELHQSIKTIQRKLDESSDLERRVKSSEEEKSLLLERCLSGENEVEELRQTIKTIQRKLDDSHAALQELGRENQSLQMESAKLQGRKWADDSVVTNCSTCEKEFTLTIRKHHCRHCGQIFCNDCSSRTSAVPSCKKPARVCDACYQELVVK